MIRQAIDIVVVTHNSKDVIEETLLAAAVASVGLQVRTWVVDNLSTDGCPDHVREHCGWVRSLDLASNKGFAAGCNHGTSLGESPYVLFLNPDCVLAPNAIRQMLSYLSSHEQVVGVGPLQVGKNGLGLPSHHRFPTVLGELDRTFARITGLFGGVATTRNRVRPGRVDWISGACMLIKRSALERVGPFDDGFFLYYEETDWCLRAAQLGFEIHHDPRVSVEHRGGTSVLRSVAGKGKSRASTVFSASRRRYFQKHHGLLTALMVDLLHQARRAVDWIKGVQCKGEPS